MTGSRVLSREGREWGVTPLQLNELAAGAYTFTLRRQGYEPALVAMDIVASQTNSFRTNLLNSSYAGAISAARQYLAAGDYDKALQAVAEAMDVKPNDPAANTLQQEVTAHMSLRRARELGKGGIYSAAIKELESALAVLPDNAEAKILLADFKKGELNKAERLRQERINGPKLVFDSALRWYGDADLFEPHELKVKNSRPITEIESAIVKALETAQPAFHVTRHSPSQPETFQVEGRQEVSGGERKCVIVGGQPRDGETQVFFEVLEYQTHSSISVQGLLNVTRTTELIAVHPKTIGELTDKLRAQLQEGVSNVTERIRSAIGQNAAQPQ